MTTTQVPALQRHSDVVDAPDVRRMRHGSTRQRIAGLVACIAFAAGLGYVTGNEVQANSQVDQAHTSLAATRGHIRTVLADMAHIRHDLDLANGQVAAATTALARDQSELKGVQTALANGQADVLHQSLAIDKLQACLGGVEQASNALAVDDQNGAIAALNAVSSSCTGAVASNG
jgi:hypothetical protein